ncbi:hypothetical protein IID24_05005 [Patescibacteria group bacterium]|nr:hypothetical protein [Patescibacteria group bacterium]
MTKFSFLKLVLVFGAILLVAGLAYTGWRISQGESQVGQPGVASLPDFPTRPAKNVDVVGPLSINALPGLVSGTSWDSGFIALEPAITLSGLDGVIIDVEFADGILQMMDTSGLSLENFSLELTGTTIISGKSTFNETTDTVNVVFFFYPVTDEYEAAPAFGSLTIFATEEGGFFKQSVNLIDSEFLFGGFTLEIFQDGAGSVEITGFRVSLEADAIIQGSVLLP